MRSPDLAALLSGACVAGLGVVLLLDQAGSLTLQFGSLAPLVLAAVGVILLVGGLIRRDTP